jgi:putative addiction module antidote
MLQIKLRKIGNSLGLCLPKEVTANLRSQAGDVLTLVRTKDGYLLTPYDPDFAETMKVFERGRKKYRNALRELAK